MAGIPATLLLLLRHRLKLTPVVVVDVVLLVVNTTSHINDSRTRDYHIARERALARALSFPLSLFLFLSSPSRRSSHRSTRFPTSRCATDVRLLGAGRGMTVVREEERRGRAQEGRIGWQGWGATGEEQIARSRGETHTHYFSRVILISAVYSRYPRAQRHHRRDECPAVDPHRVSVARAHLLHGGGRGGPTFTRWSWSSSSPSYATPPSFSTH